MNASLHCCQDPPAIYVSLVLPHITPVVCVYQLFSCSCKKVFVFESLYRTRMSGRVPRMRAHATPPPLTFVWMDQFTGVQMEASGERFVCSLGSWSKNIGGRRDKGQAKNAKIACVQLGGGGRGRGGNFLCRHEWGETETIAGKNADKISSRWKETVRQLREAAAAKGEMVKLRFRICVWLQAEAGGQIKIVLIKSANWGIASLLKFSRTCYLGFVHSVVNVMLLGKRSVCTCVERHSRPALEESGWRFQVLEHWGRFHRSFLNSSETFYDCHWR